MNRFLSLVSEYLESAGLLGRMISLFQGRYLHKTT
jgi:hypothetical protein